MISAAQYMQHAVWIYFSSEHTVFCIPDLNCGSGHLRGWVWILPQLLWHCSVFSNRHTTPKCHRKFQFYREQLGRESKHAKKASNSSPHKRSIQQTNILKQQSHFMGIPVSWEEKATEQTFLCQHTVSYLPHICMYPLSGKSLSDSCR